MSGDDRVLIVGAGPVGLLTAYGLSRAGIPVIVFEQGAALYDDPRAATTHPATLELLDGWDLVEDVEAAGLVCEELKFWNRPTGEMVACFDHGVLAGETKFPYVVQCEQFKLSGIVMDRLREFSSCEIKFSHDVTEVDQTDDRVRVSGNGPDGPFEASGRYAIGADGGRSAVRKSADIEFEGFTYPERFIVLTTPFNFQSEREYVYRNYFADPEEWCNLFKVAGDGPPGLWRAVFPTQEEETDEYVLSDEGAQERLQRFFPKNGDYPIVHRNLYVTHQRVAKKFRRGRILLAGDAAHVNNPIGGMGLNGGIHDAINLVEKLSPIVNEGADDSALDLYDLQRRTACVEFIQAQTIQNKKRLEETDPDIRAANLRELTDMAADPKRAKAFLMGSSMITAVRRAASLSL